MGLIEDDSLGKLVQKTLRVCFGKFPLVESFKRYIAVVGKGMPHQRGLAGLAGTRDDKHWIALGEVFQSGFRVSGAVGHGGFCLHYMPTLLEL